MEWSNGKTAPVVYLPCSSVCVSAHMARKQSRQLARKLPDIHFLWTRFWKIPSWPTSWAQIGRIVSERFCVEVHR
jgi:hypothetical protein